MNDMDPKDIESQFTERLLRERLGDAFSDRMLEQVRETEQRLVTRKDALVELLDIGLLTPDEYVAKLNSLLGIHLQSVAALIGEDHCRAIYRYGPDDEVQLISPNQFVERYERPRNVMISAECLVRIAADEIAAEASTAAMLRDPRFRQQLTVVVQAITASSDLAMNSALAACLQAAQLAQFVASALHEQAAEKNVAWNVADKVIALHGWLLDASGGAPRHFAEMLLRDVQAGGDTERHSQNIAEWLLDRLIETSRILDAGEIFSTYELPQDER